MEATRWKVGITQLIRNLNSPNIAFGFSIQDQHGAPLLTISYRTEAESKSAEVAVRLAIQDAVEISASRP